MALSLNSVEMRSQMTDLVLQQRYSQATRDSWRLSGHCLTSVQPRARGCQRPQEREIHFPTS
jgi:hypothetical protein